ncbi:MAG: DEAD/DEAH box helicase family protein, partial [Lachnospiraceae bacterium]|nr:DEAD/DEAH box helicase family protein [Lachnospiraceae bacterium]
MDNAADREQDSALDLGLGLNHVLTGGRQNDRYLLYTLRVSISYAKSIDIIVSFLMESGVKMLINDLQSAVDREVPIRILTGNYLGITQPSALYLLRSAFGDRIDLRFYTDAKRSFHAKAYLFHRDNYNEIYVGSSNLSKSALTNGIEWNYRFSDRDDPRSYRRFEQTFTDLFYGDDAEIIDDTVLQRYSGDWHRPAVFKDLDRYDRKQDPGEKPSGTIPLYEPRGAQIEALYQLERSRKEGAEKALVQAATGIGKTYLAAFDSRSYERVLFVAHRHEILEQAARSFHNVRPEDSIGYFEGGNKETGAKLTFASVETLGRAEYLNERYFAPDAFDYLVIDEFHHAVNDSYLRIISYFKPKFMLGLTATPERMDGRDIYALCDYSVPYELSLRDAINKGYLCPFRYYGVYDSTDYSKLHLVRGHYEEKELNETYIGNTRRYELIAKYYNKYASQRALGFCCSRKHAEDMAREFQARGIPSAAVVSGEPGPCGMDREEALQKLRTGELRVIFSVDMFNEGLDVPDIDLVMFLRPTESPVVFLQQLGRGLRKAPGKDYLIVLDFIGNYEKAGRIPLLLTGDGVDHGNGSGTSQNPQAYPDDCIVDFDMGLIDLFRKLRERTFSIQNRIDEEVDRIRALL